MVETKYKTPDGQSLLTLICEALDERKAKELVVLPLAGKADFAESMVVVTASSSRHGKALGDSVASALKARGDYCVIEGENSSDWLIIDSLLVVVHIFSQEARDKYDLVGLWG